MDVVKMGLPQISTINRGQMSKEAGITVFETMILDLLEYYGVEWNPPQIRSVAELMFDEYYYWSLAELKHFILKVKRGDYGKLFGKFSPSNIVDYASTYNSELLVARSTYRKPEPEQTGEFVSSERIRAALGEFADKWEQNIREQKKAANEEEKRQKEQERDKMLRKYCEAHGIDLETLRAELYKNVA